MDHRLEGRGPGNHVGQPGGTRRVQHLVEYRAPLVRCHQRDAMALLGERDREVHRGGGLPVLRLRGGDD